MSRCTARPPAPGPDVGISAGSRDGGVRSEAPSSCPQSPGLHQEGLERPSSFHAGLGSVWGHGSSDPWLIPACIPHPGGLAAPEPGSFRPLPGVSLAAPKSWCHQVPVPVGAESSCMDFCDFFSYFSSNVVIFVPPYKSLPCSGWREDLWAQVGGTRLPGPTCWNGFVGMVTAAIPARGEGSGWESCPGM